MSIWTNIVWRQATSALLNGTENCDIPHNTLELSCDENDDGIDWMVNMMSKVNSIKYKFIYLFNSYITFILDDLQNLKHDPGNLQLPFKHLLPTLNQLDFIKDARGINIRIPQNVVEQTSDKFQNMENRPEETKNYLNDPSDLEPTIIITSRYTRC